MVGLPRQYIRFPDGRIEECFNVDQYAAWYADIKNRRIFYTAVPFGEGLKQAVIISTVFTGFEFGFHDDEKPVLFATLATLPQGQEFNDHYTTEDDARLGHEKIVRKVELAMRGFDESGFSAGLQALFKNPLDRTPSTLRPCKDFIKKAPERSCPCCKGRGTYTTNFGFDAACDCTVTKS